MSRGAAGHLVRMLLAKQGGYDEVPPVVPAHLVDALWRFRCQCRDPVLATDSATIRQGVITPPSRYCPTCRTWNRGTLVSR